MLFGDTTSRIGITSVTSGLCELTVERLKVCGSCVSGDSCYPGGTSNLIWVGTVEVAALLVLCPAG